MKASTYIKSYGLPSLAYVAKMINKHPDTIGNWYRDNFALFEIIVAGCVSKTKSENKELLDIQN